MANKQTVTQYYKFFQKHLVDSNGDNIRQSVKPERVYLTDERGQGVQSKHKQVIGHNGGKHFYQRNTNVENRKTLILGICGNDVIIRKVLNKTFPHVGEGESEHMFYFVIQRIQGKTCFQLVV